MIVIPPHCGLVVVDRLSIWPARPHLGRQGRKLVRGPHSGLKTASMAIGQNLGYRPHLGLRTATRFIDYSLAECQNLVRNPMIGHDRPKHGLMPKTQFERPLPCHNNCRQYALSIMLGINRSEHSPIRHPRIIRATSILHMLHFIVEKDKPVNLDTESRQDFFLLHSILFVHDSSSRCVNRKL